MRQVANVLANKRLAVYHQGDGVLEIRAERQHWTADRQSRHCAWGKSARAAKDHGAECASACNRIVYASRDRTFTDKKGICDSREPLQRIRILIRDWFVRAVGARHHQRFRSACGEEQVVEWCVGQHYTEIMVVWRAAFDFKPGR